MLTPSEARAAEGFRKLFTRCFDNANPNAIRALLDRLQSAKGDPSLIDSVDPANRLKLRIHAIAAEVAAQVFKPILFARAAHDELTPGQLTASGAPPIHGN